MFRLACGVWYIWRPVRRLNVTFLLPRFVVAVQKVLFISYKISRQLSQSVQQAQDRPNPLGLCIRFLHFFSFFFQLRGSIDFWLPWPPLAVVDVSGSRRFVFRTKSWPGPDSLVCRVGFVHLCNDFRHVTSFIKYFFENFIKYFLLNLLLHI